MLSDFVLVILGLAGLFLGGESLVKGAARLASALGVPPLIVGLTVVALGTSMPELLVSLNAALGGASDIALGNVLGSNIANIGLILGISGLIFPLTVEWRLIRQEIPLMIIVSVILMLMSLDGEIGRGDGVILVIGFAAFNLFSILSAIQSRRQITPELSEFVEEEQLTPLKAD
ncbi:sodium:calcium antiporter, partial [bacterium]|nr:sodium:calcium antiporter [bacterium]